jgi:DNA-binding MarR family transcriptional regulator
VPRARGIKADAAGLYAAMTSLLRVYQFRDRDRSGYRRVTITQVYVLECLARRGPLTLNALAAEMRLDKSTLSRVVDTLERKRFAGRRQNSADGRSVLLAATARGLRQYHLVERDLIAENARVLARFPARSRRLLIQLILAMTDAAAQRRLDLVDE